MIDIFEKYATDENLEETGAVINIGGDSTITVARAENDEYVKLILSEYEKHKVDLLDPNSDKAKETDKAIIINALARTVLLGWSNLKYKGKIIKYSISNAKKLLAHRDFRRMVIMEAQNIENYRAKFEEEDSKN